MEGLIQTKIHCPYCGEMIEVLLDPEELGGEYIEDCQVCCRPIIFSVSDSEYGISVNTRTENDSW
jgi:hypothetical protein